jgi:hypothetical protein
MNTKICFKCNIDKPLSEYYVHPQMGDGHLNKCKDCTKKDTQNRTNILMKSPEFVQSEKDRGRLKYHRLGYVNKYKPTKESKKEIMRRYYEKYPEKKIAGIVSQRIFPRIKGNNMHHWSYNKEHLKDVIELSVKDHNTAHRFIIYDQERMMYRTLNGELLDTKERHIEYINKVILSNNSFLI